MVYDVVVAGPSFANGSSYDLSLAQSDLEFYPQRLENIQAKATQNQLTTLSNAECMIAYTNAFMVKYRNVVLVTSNEDSNSSVWTSLKPLVKDPYPYGWICTARTAIEYNYDSYTPCEISSSIQEADNWIILQHKIEYCLAEPVEEACTINLSVGIMIAVIVSNFVKAICLFVAFWKFNTPALITIGDAVASFLVRPDISTAGMCLMSKEDIIRGAWSSRLPKVWVSSQRSWFHAPSKKRWVATISM
jgi:hypothetical protein